MAYYQIDWDAIRALTPREQLEVLADIAATVPVEMAQERVRIVGRTVERHAAERPWGAQSRAAEELGLGTARVGQLWTEYKEHHMTTTTSYGTFVGNVADPGGAGSMRDYVTTALGDYADAYDIDAIVDEYRDAINDALDGTGITLAGDEFYGPHPGPENVAEIVADAIESVDFWTIVERHDKSEN